MFCSVARAALLLGAPLAAPYPVTIENCGVSHTYDSAPTRAITMNQAATEFMLALGLEDHMVGTAYLDDFIWPKYASAYAQIPILSATYPNETQIVSQNPDFILASWRSAFRATYTKDDGSTRGIYSNATVGPCTGPGSEWEDDELNTCRPQLHAEGIGTYLNPASCEDPSLRPDGGVSEEIVYDEMRTLGSIFDVDVEPLISEMKEDFDAAAALVSASMGGAPLRTVWLDCVGCCNSTALYIGAGDGTPNMLMEEAGLTNLFADHSGSWACINATDVAAADPDLIIVVYADWDTSQEKIEYMYKHPAFCATEVVQRARFVSIPFSATELSPRNGAAAYDLAVSALHVRGGQQTASQESGVSSLNPFELVAWTTCSVCPLGIDGVDYTGDDQGFVATSCTKTSTTEAPSTAPSNEVSSATKITTEAPSTAPSNEVSTARRGSLGVLCWALAAALLAVRPRVAQA